jgi:hypothetical protein
VRAALADQPPEAWITERELATVAEVRELHDLRWLYGALHALERADLAERHVVGRVTGARRLDTVVSWRLTAAGRAETGA